MCRTPAPSPAPDPDPAGEAFRLWPDPKAMAALRPAGHCAFARALMSGPDPDAEDIMFALRRIGAFGSPRVEVRWPTFAETQAEASDGEVRAIARQYSVPAAALFALAEKDGERSRNAVEGRAFWLMRHLERGEALETILSPAVLARMSEMEG